MANLEDAISKIEWAKRHIAELEISIKRFFDANPIEFFRELNTDGMNELVKVKLTKLIPRDVSLLTGDIIHHLRASLDYAACSLAELNGTTKTSDVYFPFGADQKAFEQPLTQGKIKRLSTTAKDFICALKPYRGGNDLLWLIHYLDLGDKHRKLTPIGMSGSTGGYIECMTEGSISFATPKWESLENGMRVATVSRGANLQGNIHIKLDIAFGEVVPIKGKPVVAVINQLCRTAERIIDDIDKNFFK